MSAVIEHKEQPSLLAKIASKYSVEPSKMLATLKETAFKGNVNNEQMMALLIVADQYGLNPWTKEIYAFPDKGGIVPVVGVDGWARIINEHPQFDGVEFHYADDAVTCAIFRKDRSHPTTVTEFMSECRRETGPWKSHPKRMLRHKALIQCARLAFGYAGIYDQDEAERIIEVSGARLDDTQDKPKRGVSALKERIARKESPEPPESPAAAPPSPAAVPGGSGPTLADALFAVNKGDYDLAADLASSFGDEAREKVEAAIKAEMTK